MADCKIYEKGKQYHLCKAPQLDNTFNCFKSQKYDTYAYKKEHYQCISKKYFATCIINKEKCANYK